MATATKRKKQRAVKLQPLGDRVLVEREEAEKRTAGGIVLPDKARDMRWRQFHGQSGCLRLLGKGTFPGSSEYRCLSSVVPVGMGASPAVNPGDFAGQGAA
jgi:hypothetical protein